MVLQLQQETKQDGDEQLFWPLTPQKRTILYVHPLQGLINRMVKWNCACAKYFRSIYNNQCMYIYCMFQSKVCGIHFPDGQPTRENPYPVLFMGYDCRATPARPPPKKRCLQPLHLNSAIEQMETDVDVGNLENLPLQTRDVGIQWPDHMDHNYSFSCGNKPMKDCGTQTDPTPSVSAKNLNTIDFIFHTGLCADSFWLLFRVILTFCSQPLNTKLAVHEQFLLVLMRLCLGLLFTDLGKRFGVSRTTASEIFTFWRPILARFMREKVIVWLPRDTLKRIRPKTFNKIILKQQASLTALRSLYKGQRT
uniref:Transposase Helix-turn-helix domain-containing protein n=1 Tax=Oryzias sinensis TaxID=183150 RepID=A0A8C7XR19_9TELE